MRLLGSEDVRLLQQWDQVVRPRKRGMSTLLHQDEANVLPSRRLQVHLAVTRFPHLLFLSSNTGKIATNSTWGKVRELLAVQFRNSHGLAWQVEYLYAPVAL